MNRLGTHVILEYVSHLHLCPVYSNHLAPKSREVLRDMLHKTGGDDSPSKLVAGQSVSCREIVVVPAPLMLDDLMANSRPRQPIDSDSLSKMSRLLCFHGDVP